MLLSSHNIIHLIFVLYFTLFPISSTPPRHTHTYSISITYSTTGADRGKITKLVTDMVLDRRVGNTDGLSGISAAAYIAGAPSNALWDVLAGSVPPAVALGRFFGRPLKSIDNKAGGGGGLPPFPDSVMIQLAKGVLASNLGLDDSNLLAENFVYIEPLMGPFDKDKYLKVFGEEYDVRGAVPDLDYGLQVSSDERDREFLLYEYEHSLLGDPFSTYYCIPSFIDRTFVSIHMTLIGSGWTLGTYYG